MNCRGYAELIQNIGKVISDQPLYSQPFYDLFNEVVEAEKYKKQKLAEIIGYSRQTIYNHLNYIYNDKYMTVVICVGLGLDLVSTMIFLISKGYILNPIVNAIDKKTIEFLYSYDKDDDSRAIDYRVNVLREEF